MICFDTHCKGVCTNVNRTIVGCKHYGIAFAVSSFEVVFYERNGVFV